VPTEQSSANRGFSRRRGKPRQRGRGSWTPWRKFLLAGGLSFWVVASLTFVYFYVHFSFLIDSRLSGNLFHNSSLVYSAPTPVEVGEPATAEDFAARLRRAGYVEGSNPTGAGSYSLVGNHLEIHPGPASFFNGPVVQEGPAVLAFSQRHLAAITSLGPNRTPLENYWLEPELITPLFGANRAKRRVVSYSDLPKDLIQAVVSAEDHTFYTNPGINFYRVLGAAVADIRAGRKAQGASTITMQVARNIVLENTQRTWRRKFEEAFVALLLEHRLSKEQILDLYANDVYLGQRGSFSIYGFGEAANAYFNKDVSRLTLPQAALLAGLIRGPNLYSPYSHAARAIARRNYVIQEMLGMGFITPKQAAQASGAPLGVTPGNIEANEAPYFVDMVRDQLLRRFSQQDLISQGYRIYTTLDLDLQRAASDAARLGMAEVDKEVKQQRRRPPPGRDEPQVALVAINPQTGGIGALIGGRDYGWSQLNHALAMRQPGSSFKPLVYATALSSAVDGSQPVITPATTLMDEPTTFQFGGQTYEPHDYKEEYHGLVTVREAITFSLNVATVSLAQMTGYEKIRDLAIAAGINKGLEATPAMALGAYVATPVEIAGAYTIFDDAGTFVAPRAILEVTDSSGKVLYRSPEISRPVLDPRVAFLMDSLMESVIDHGTGEGVRARGFTLPAAGKTGTSHDGWFSGFTSNLICTVWVGYDDNRQLDLSGARSALPVWTDFMKQATELPDYQNVQPFTPPPGIVSEMVDQQGRPLKTAQLASADPASDDPTTDHLEYFIDGTQPQRQTPIQKFGGILKSFFTGGAPATTPGSGNAVQSLPAAVPPPATIASPAASTPAPIPSRTAARRKKSGFFRKFMSIFKSSKSKPEQNSSPAQNPP
jgi:penicillin-binding protein 1B